MACRGSKVVTGRVGRRFEIQAVFTFPSVQNSQSQNLTLNPASAKSLKVTPRDERGVLGVGAECVRSPGDHGVHGFE